MDFMLQQKIKKRKNEIAFLEYKIKNLERVLSKETNENSKKQCNAQIKRMKDEIEILERKNRRFEW